MYPNHMLKTMILPYFFSFYWCCTPEMRTLTISGEVVFIDNLWSKPRCVDQEIHPYPYLNPYILQVQVKASPSTFCQSTIGSWG